MRCGTLVGPVGLVRQNWCAAVDLALVLDKPVFAIMFGPQTETTLCVCRSHGDLAYRRAGWQSAGVVVVLTQPTCINQWTRRPLAETSIDPCRSREPAKALRAERAGLERNKPLRYSATGAPTHVGANGVKPEQLSPPEISRRLSQGGAVIKDERL